MSKVTRFVRGLIVACVGALGLSAAAVVGDTVTWSSTNTQATGDNLAYSNWQICLRAQDGLPAGSKVKLNTIKLARRSGNDRDAYAYKILVVDGTDAVSAEGENGGAMEINAKETPETRDSRLYTFESAVLTVGVVYEMRAVNDEGAEVSADASVGGATGVNIGGSDWAVRWSNRTDWMPVAVLSGTVVSYPEREAVDYEFDASTQTWTPSEPTELTMLDTVSYTGTGAATLAMNVICPLTVGAGVALTINGDCEISGVSKFEAGSTLTIASGKTTIYNAQNGTNSDRGLMGTIIVESDATLALPKNDMVNYSGSTEMHVKGTLALGTNRQSLGPNNKLYVYVGGLVTGAGDGNAALDFVDNNNGIGVTFLDIEGVETKTAEISAVVRGNADSRNIAFDVPAGVVATISGVIKQGNVVKNGAGTLKPTAVNTYRGQTTINAGTVIASNKDSLGNSGFIHTVKVNEGGNVTFERQQYVNSRINLDLVGTGVNGEGALLMSGDGSDSQIQFTGLTLSGDATIWCEHNGGLLGPSFAKTTIELNGHVLTKTGPGGFNLVNTTIQDSSAAKSGSVVIEAGSLRATNAGSGNVIKVPVTGAGTIKNEYKPLTIDTDGRDFTVSANITGNPVTKVGAGILTLAGNNGFTTLNVNEGEVKNAKTATNGGKGLGAYSAASTDCDALSLITVAEGAKLDVNAIAGSGYGNCYRVELAGELTNSGNDMGTSMRQLSKITVTGDQAKITGNTYCLLGSGYAATKLELGEHTLEIALNEGEIFHLRTTTVSGTGTIKVTSGQLHHTTGMTLADESAVKYQVAIGAEIDDGVYKLEANQVSPIDPETMQVTIVRDCVYTAIAKGPATWDDVTAADLPTEFANITSDALTALKQWAKGVGAVALADRATVKLDAFLANVANSTETIEIVITEEDLAAILANDLRSIQAKYPNAVVTLVEVNLEGASASTKLYRLRLSLPVVAE